MKKMTTIRINKEIYQKAKELGLNISKICENALKIYISRLQGVNTEIGNLGSARVRSLVGRTSPSRGEGRRFKSGRAHQIMARISFSFLVLFFFSL